MASNDKKESILQAAFHLFASKGFHKTKMIDIAEAAGIGKGTIYEYFSGKDTLYIEFIKENFLGTYKSVDNLFTENSSAAEKLKKFVCFEAENISANGKIFGLLEHEMKNIEPCRNQNIRRLFFEVQYLRFNIVKKIIEEGIKTEEFKQTDLNTAASAVLGSLTAFQVFSHKLHPLSGNINEEIHMDQFIEILLNGLNNENT